MQVIAKLSALSVPLTQTAMVAWGIGQQPSKRTLSDPRSDERELFITGGPPVCLRGAALNSLAGQGWIFLLVSIWVFGYLPTWPALLVPSLPNCHGVFRCDKFLKRWIGRRSMGRPPIWWTDDTNERRTWEFVLCASLKINDYVI